MVLDNTSLWPPWPLYTVDNRCFTKILFFFSGNRFYVVVNIVNEFWRLALVLAMPTRKRSNHILIISPFISFSRSLNHISLSAFPLWHSVFSIIINLSLLSFFYFLPPSSLYQFFILPFLYLFIFYSWHAVIGLVAGVKNILLQNSFILSNVFCKLTCTRAKMWGQLVSYNNCYL